MASPRRSFPKQQLLSWLLQALLLTQALLPTAVVSHAVTEDDEAFVQEMWGHLERKGQTDRELLFGFGARNAGEICEDTDQCAKGLECGRLSSEASASRCMPRKTCLQHELRDMGNAFDPIGYKNMVLVQAGVSEADLWQARLDHDDDVAFANSAPVKAFMDTIEKHREELEEYAYLMTSCGDGPVGTTAMAASAIDAPMGRSGGPGAFVGSLFDAAMKFIFGEQETPAPTTSPTTPAPTVSSMPSTSAAPTECPSVAPSRMVSSRVYLGFHMEGGFLVDASYSLLNARNRPGSKRRTFGRACLGFEAGGGGEISLLIMVADNRFANDIIGGSFLFDTDIAVGLALGAATGYYVTGDMAGDSPMYIEGTIGGGLGFGVAGASICRTARADRDDSGNSVDSDSED